MRLEISSKNYKPNNHLKELIERKISKFNKYFQKEAKVNVVLSHTGSNKFTMEVTITCDNMRVRSEVTSDNMFDNIDIVLPKIERQIRKYRTRFDDRLKKDALEDAYIYQKNEELSTNNNAPKYGKLVKEKSFEITMTTVEQALEEMELLEHNFYVFLNADNGKVSIVYRRRDGDYGLISPEY